ncbi:MAG: peptidylprolyl isomerase, partial [Bacteroidota bacterium]
WNCTGPTREIEEISVNFADPEIRKILEYQHEQNIDSLLKYLEHPSANLRHQAALAFGSIQDSTIISPLSAYLADPHPAVREAVAFSIGQTSIEPAVGLLMDAFDPYDTAGVYKAAHAQILEGVGKCGNEETLELLVGISTYQRRDTQLLLGQVRGIYQLALKDVVSTDGTAKMIDFVSDETFPNEVRLMAANYLYRATDLELEDYTELLGQLIFREKDPNIRSPLVIALGKTKKEAAAAALEQRFKMDTDYRVKCNIIRALANFDYDLIQPTIMAALKDPNIHVALAAANFCRDNGDSKDATLYWRLAKDSIPTAAVPVMYTAVQRHLPPSLGEYRQSINGEVRRAFRNSTNVYHQAIFLEALAEFGWNYRFIQAEGFQHSSPVVRTKAVSLIARTLKKPDFRSFFGVSYRNVRREIAVFLKDAIRTGDPGMISIAASSLKDIGRGPQEYLIKRDSSFLEDALLQLDLPADRSAYNALREAAISFKRPTIPDPLEAEDWLTIDWELLRGLSDNPTATVSTNKGDLVLALDPAIAPESVANFVKLANDGFYTNIPFHRVVSNFVVQAGCDRGDGTGGSKQNIRTELKPVSYNKAGVLGMARSGYHTESSQFFITHSPTLHLDGNYTIFGQLLEGFDVLDNIIQGDIIQSVAIK